jgi:hypothetical protein
MINVFRIVAVSVVAALCGACTFTEEPPVKSSDMTRMRYVVLSPEEFKREYMQAFEEVTLASEAEQKTFRDLVFSVQGEVLEALKAKWKENDDFQVGWDFNYCRHACGGIYSDAIFSRDYVETVAAALNRVDSQGVWTYHTVAEIIVNPEGKTLGEMTEDRGEFFIRGNTCFVPDTMARRHRLALGCND